MANNAGYFRGTGRSRGLNNGAAVSSASKRRDLLIDTVGPTNAGTIELAGGTIEYSKRSRTRPAAPSPGRGVFRAAPQRPAEVNQQLRRHVVQRRNLRRLGDVNTRRRKIVAPARRRHVSTTTSSTTATSARPRQPNGLLRRHQWAGTFTGGGTTEFEGTLKPGNSPPNVTFGGNA